MIWILLVIQLLFIFVDYYFSGEVYIDSIMLVIINTALAFLNLKFKRKVFNILIVILFIIHTFAFGYIMYIMFRPYNHSDSYCSAAFNCNCQEGKEMCECDYMKDDFDPKSVIKVECPRSND